MSINSKIAKDKPELAFDAANDDATLSLTDQELETTRLASRFGKRPIACSPMKVRR